MRRYDEGLLDKLYTYVVGYERRHGKAPTYRAIQREMPKSFSSSAKIRGYLQVLKNRGKIETTHRGSILADERLCSESVNAPLIGRVACGQPIEAIENIEGSYSLPAGVFGHGELMMLRASGESMKGIGIDDGDLIVFRRQDTAENGEIAAVLTDDETGEGHRATLKRFYRDEESRKIRLHPENRYMEDIITDEADIMGVAVAVWKRLK